MNTKYTGDRDRKPGVWKPPTRVYLDMETCSVQDLKHVGMYRYFEDKNHAHIPGLLGGR